MAITISIISTKKSPKSVPGPDFSTSSISNDWAQWFLNVGPQTTIGLRPGFHWCVQWSQHFMQAVLKSANKTEITFSQIILENPSGSYHVEPNTLSVVKTNIIRFSLRFNRFLFIWLNTRRNIWLGFILSIRILPGITDTNLPSHVPQGNVLSAWKSAQNSLYFLECFSFFPRA